VRALLNTKNSAKEIMGTYRVQSSPVFLTLTPDALEINRIVGKNKAGLFLQKLPDIDLNRNTIDNYLSRPFSLLLTNPEWLFK